MNQSKVKQIVYVSLFTALTVIGTMIKIPLPTGGFVHLGNAVLLLAVLFLGYFKGSMAGGMGFAIFDLLNGYATEAPYFVFESFVVGAAAYGMFLLFKKNPTHVGEVLVIAAGTGIAKLGMTFLKNLVKQLLLGSSFQAAVLVSSTRLPATVINVCITAVIVSFVYFPLKRSIKESH